MLNDSSELEKRLQSLDKWAAFNYQSSVLGGKVFGKVNHFQNYRLNVGCQDVLSDFKKRFTYAYPNHYPQHKLNALLLKQG